MYLCYVYAHKASEHPNTLPFYSLLHAGPRGEDILAETQATSCRRYSGSNWSSLWLVWMALTQQVPQEWNLVPIFPGCPAGFAEFDITPAVGNWSSGVPNFGMVIRAVNELEEGRGIHFASHSNKDPKMHPFVTMLSTK